MKNTSLSQLMKLPSTNRSFAKLLLCAGALGAVGHSALAANDLWIGDTDANFGTLDNWSGSVSPDGNTPEFGVAGTAGTALNNDLSGATFTGLLFDSGASAFTIGGNSFTLTGGITNSSGSLQTINNDIALTTVPHTFSATSGNIALGGAFSGATGNVTFSGPGTTTLSGTNTFNTNQGNFGALFVGSGSGTSPTAGNLSITGATTVNSTGTGSTNGGQLVIVGASTLTIQTGGSLLIDSVVSSGGNSIIGQNATGTSTLRVNGGTLTINGAQGLAIGNNRGDTTGVLTIDSGTATINRGSTTVTDARSYIALGRDTASGTINLNGGTLATDRNFVRDGAGPGANGGTANFVFGGGTLKALANQSDWLKSTTTNTYLQALSSVTTTAVSTIDSNGFSVAINNAISGAGGFNIMSSTPGGTVIFGGTNTFTGDVAVNSGTLSLATNVSLNDTIVLSLAPNTSLNLAFATGFSETIKGLVLNGTPVADGTYTSTDLNALGLSSSISFTSSGGTLTVSAVPEPGTVALISLGLLFGMIAFRRSRAPTIS